MSIWMDLYNSEENLEDPSPYLDAMLKHVEVSSCRPHETPILSDAPSQAHAAKYESFKSFSIPPPPELGRDVSTHEQVRRKRAYFRKRDFDREELVTSFWNFEDDAEAIRGRNFKNLMVCTFLAK